MVLVLVGSLPEAEASHYPIPTRSLALLTRFFLGYVLAAKLMTIFLHTLRKPTYTVWPIGLHYVTVVLYIPTTVGAPKDSHHPMT